MKEQRYSFHVDPSPEGGWTVWFPDLPGCDGWAATLADVAQEAETVSGLWLESERRRMHPIPAPGLASGPEWPQGSHIEIDGSGPLIGVPDAARALGVSVRRIQALAKERSVGRRFGRYVMFTAADIAALRPGPVGRPRKPEAAPMHAAAD